MRKSSEVELELKLQKVCESLQTPESRPDILDGGLTVGSKRHTVDRLAVFLYDMDWELIPHQRMMEK